MADLIGVGTAARWPSQVIALQFFATEGQSEGVRESVPAINAAHINRKAPLADASSTATLIS
jgi:hypothetical protein